MKELTTITTITGTQPVNPKAVGSLEDLHMRKLKIFGQIHVNGFAYLLSDGRLKLRYSLVDGEHLCVCKVMHNVESNFGNFISLLVPTSITSTSVKRGGMIITVVSSNELVSIKEHDAIAMGIDTSSLCSTSLVLIDKDQMVAGMTGPRPYSKGRYKSIIMAKIHVTRQEAIPFSTNEETGMATAWVMLERRTQDMEMTFEQKPWFPLKFYRCQLDYSELESFGLKNIPRKRFLWIEIDVFGHFTGRTKL